jgi:hypothetical protein
MAKELEPPSKKQGDAGKRKHTPAPPEAAAAKPHGALVPGLDLHRKVGNRAFGQMLQGPAQSKEAPEPGPSSAGQAPNIVRAALRSPGQPLDPATRAFMEPRFGQEFNRVRVHTDAQAAESAKALDADAYTVGQEIVFASGRYVPHSVPGKSLLAHELAHVAQQANAAQTGGQAVSDPGDEFEAAADKTARAVLGGSHAVVTKGGSPPAIQRQAANQPKPNLSLVQKNHYDIGMVSQDDAQKEIEKFLERALEEQTRSKHGTHAVEGGPTLHITEPIRNALIKLFPPSRDITGTVEGSLGQFPDRRPSIGNVLKVFSPGTDMARTGEGLLKTDRFADGTPKAIAERLAKLLPEKIPESHLKDLQKAEIGEPGPSTLGKKVVAEVAKVGSRSRPDVEAMQPPPSQWEKPGNQINKPTTIPVFEEHALAASKVVVPPAVKAMTDKFKKGSPRKVSSEEMNACVLPETPPGVTDELVDKLAESEDLWPPSAKGRLGTAEYEYETAPTIDDSRIETVKKIKEWFLKQKKHKKKKVSAKTRESVEKDYNDGPQIANVLVCKLAVAQAENATSVNLHLKESYNTVRDEKDREAIYMALERIARGAQGLLPPHATPVKTLNIYFGNQFVRKIGL